MKVLSKMVVLLGVLGFCLPSYGEILVYKFTQNGTSFDETEEGWDVQKGVDKGYMVIDVDYVEGTITQAELTMYGKNAEGKWLRQIEMNLELIRVEVGTKVQWIVMQKSVEEVPEGLSGGFYMLAGLARGRSVGTEEKQEVANTLKGYGLEDTLDEGTGRSVGMRTLSVTLYPAWTYWANGDGDEEGGQDFGTATQMITDNLAEKGYEEEI